MIPQTNKSFELSRSALTITIAAVLLASLLATATVSNIKREETLMQNFLLHEGQTLIRVFEAGARTTMMHNMRGGDPLATLVTETVKEPSVIYIIVVNENGQREASAGLLPEAEASPSVSEVLAAEQPITTLLSGDKAVFEIAAPFKPIANNSHMNTMQGNWQHQWGGMGEKNDHDQSLKVIYLGLSTREFDQARQTDIGHALLLGAILFLAGVAGLYLLFVNQRKRVAEGTLADMELYTKNVIESMPTGLITLDAEGCVVSCNSQAERITGKTLLELAGKKLAEEVAACPLIYPDSPQLLDEPIECGHGDEIIPIRLSSSRLVGAGGAVTGLVLIMRDVREIQEMEQKLERSRRLASLGRMAAGIAHEIRNPLGTLRGFAQFFKNKFIGQETEQGYATLMIDEIDRLNRIISGLLQFAKPREPEFQQLSITPLLDKAVKLLADDCKNHGVELHLQAPATEITMHADPDLLLQAVINLLKNSIEASGQGDTITITSLLAEKDVVITIEDTGRGATAEEQTRMFDPFYTTRKTGTGLGLAIVHQIMNQHNGVVEVQSELGKGTAISLIFRKRSMNTTLHAL